MKQIRMDFIVVLILIVNFYDIVSAHGYLADPPARSSAWLTDSDFVECCTNYDHMQMFCGGTNALWGLSGGKCGICGEPINEAKEFEKGGSKYLGKIVRTYRQAGIVNVSVVITANHYGYFEFRICNVDGWAADANQECLNKTILQIVNSNESRLFVRNYSSPATIQYQLRLPTHLTCKRCVMQWKYVAGNRWGTDDETNESCMGCGVIQEHFYGCSDVRILGTDEVPEPETTRRITTTTTKTTVTKTTTTTTTTGGTNTNNRSSLAPPTTTTTIDNTYDGCVSKLPFDDTMNLSKLVSIFCSRICKPKCFETTDSNLINKNVCKMTCKTLCDCKLNK